MSNVNLQIVLGEKMKGKALLACRTQYLVDETMNLLNGRPFSLFFICQHN
jgi:hypothetical protein